MSVPRDVMELWARIADRAMRRVPSGWMEYHKVWRLAADRQRLMEKWGESWLKTSGLVPRSRYLDVLDENERLRRRVAELERRMGITESGTASSSVEGVFDEMMQAQRRWLDTWMPRPPSSHDKQED